MNAEQYRQITERLDAAKCELYGAARMLPGHLKAGANAAIGHIERLVKQVDDKHANDKKKESNNESV